jgi:hypothetical protein
MHGGRDVTQVVNEFLGTSTLLRAGVVVDIDSVSSTDVFVSPRSTYDLLVNFVCADSFWRTDVLDVLFTEDEADRVAWRPVHPQDEEGCVPNVFVGSYESFNELPSSEKFVVRVVRKVTGADDYADVFFAAVHESIDDKVDDGGLYCTIERLVMEQVALDVERDEHFSWVTGGTPFFYEGDEDGEVSVEWLD